MTAPESLRLLYNPSVRILVILVLSSALVSAQPSSTQTTGVDANLRGISVSHPSNNEDQRIVWASGTQGTVLRSADEGKSWKQLHVDGGADLDFRDIEAFGVDTAYLMSSGDGDRSRIYKTVDQGKSWALQYTDTRAGFFLDSLVCDSPIHCFALSDPVEGKFLILATNDGQRWNELSRDKMPGALPAEGAFAASGTSIALCGNDVYFGTGGPSARVFHSTDQGRSWSVSDTPMAAGAASAGIFSIACGGDHTLIVGGDYKNPNRAAAVAAYSDDRGKTWHLADKQPGGYRSAVRTASGMAVAVGPNGQDVSFDFGVTWQSMDTKNLNAAALTSTGVGWAVGPGGAATKFQMQVSDLNRRSPMSVQK
jgi:photosystem II stability/assembly factor-like uncharacterized protein